MNATTTMTGVLFNITAAFTRQGRGYAYGEITDRVERTDRIGVTILPNEYETYGPLLTLGAELTFTGRLDDSGDVPRLIAEQVEATR